MKIGMLTLPFNNNYGGYLQAYALMTVLKGMGHDVELIYRKHNYRPLFLRIKYFIKTLVKCLLGQKHELLIMDQEKELRYKGKDLMPFVDKYIAPKTRPLFSTEQLRKECKGKYDAIVVGSDQVWRPDYVSNIENFFLDFIDNPQILKFSYAASFGTSSPIYSDKEKRICGDLIKKFNAVSVRERSGVDVVCNLGWFNGRAEVVLDPTMLLDLKNYEQFIIPSNENYVVAYILDMDEDKECGVRDIARELALPMKNLSLSGKQLPSMETWLSCLYNSKFIVTDSFHGAVFSILFNRNFIVYANQERGVDRFFSLLKTFNIENRMILDKNGIWELLHKKIDWEIVNERLEINKMHSMSFLRKVLGK